MVSEAGDKEVNLSGERGGKSMTVAIGKPAPKSVCQLNTDEIVKMQLEANITDRLDIFFTI